ncbi:MAG: 3-hydroxyacyl-CoA dehydrogenase [Syntrophales bacterium LBB04]|nr:3-hydroxyacyl-CoA dehydrogenase [Syntrophales bacterium LBB04]
MDCRTVAVIGAGTMGSGIAQSIARAGMEVVLTDVGQQLVDKALSQIETRMNKEVEKGKMTVDEKAQVAKRIQGSVGLENLRGADLVVEAVIEDVNIKGDIFRELNRICSPAALFATNTSTLSVTRLGALSGRPDRFMGLHFFNPAHIMKLTEVVPGLTTSNETVQFGVEFVKRLGKAPVVVQDCPGFVVNRILLPYVMEAFVAAGEGVSPAEIDEAVRKAGFPMGPLELSDMVGIDVSLHTFPILHDAYGDRFPVPPLPRKLCESGRLGVKTKKGVYSDGKIDDEFLLIVKGLQSKSAHVPFTAERLIVRQVNEAVYCLREGIASAADIDRAMVLGTGFPADKNGIGGPLHWADEKGLDHVLALLDQYKDSLGARFWPHPLLKNYVHAGLVGSKANKGFFTYVEVI